MKCRVKIQGCPDLAFTLNTLTLNCAFVVSCEK